MAMVGLTWDLYLCLCFHCPSQLQFMDCSSGVLCIESGGWDVPGRTAMVKFAGRHKKVRGEERQYQHNPLSDDSKSIIKSFVRGQHGQSYISQIVKLELEDMQLIELLQMLTSIEELSLVLLPSNQACLRFIIGCKTRNIKNSSENTIKNRMISTIRMLMLFEQLMEMLLVIMLSTKVYS